MNDFVQALPGEFIQIETNKWTEPFWAAARESRLVAARCGECGTFRMPPSPYCPNCLSQKVDWPQLSGAGVLYSYTIVRDAPFLGYMEFTYAPAVVDLPDAPGARLVGNLVDVSPDDIHIGMNVLVDWHPIKNNNFVPIFRVAAN